MKQKSCKWYSFLQSVRGNWRNALLIECPSCPHGETCQGFLLTADAEGRLLLLPVEELRRISGEPVEREDFRGVLSRQTFEAAFPLYLEWHTASSQACALLQLCGKGVEAPRPEGS